MLTFHCVGCDKEVDMDYCCVTDTPANLELCVTCLKNIYEDRALKYTVYEE
jgi:hypothetical protein